MTLEVIDVIRHVFPGFGVAAQVLPVFAEERPHFQDVPTEEGRVASLGVLVY